jgi:hypothetical protein
MTSKTRLGGFIGGAAVATAVGIATALAPAAAANAASHHVGTIAGVETRCNSSVYLLCLYYNSNASTAWWGSSSNVSNLAGETFRSGTGAGSGEAVKNNAAAASCDTGSTGKCYIFFNSNYGGNYDYLNGQETGKLYYTYNEDASVKIAY